MGTITRTFANNITTSGVFKPTAFNNASFDNVTAVPSGAAEGGSMVLLSTQTASASASISFTSGIDSTYKEYMFIFNNIHPATDTVEFTFNLSTDGGSNYNVTKTTTGFVSYHTETDSAAAVGYQGSWDLAQSTSDQILVTTMNTASDESVSGIMYLYDPASTTYVKHFISRANFTFNDNSNPVYSQDWFVAGYGNTTSAVNAIRFKMSSGNIDSGTIQMFGIL